jgi:hypothetical protein
MLRAHLLGGMPLSTLKGKDIIDVINLDSQVIQVILTSSFIRISSSGGGEIGSLVSSMKL